MTQRTRFAVDEKVDGFDVEVPHVGRVEVRLEPWAFVLRSAAGIPRRSGLSSQGELLREMWAALATDLPSATGFDVATRHGVREAVRRQRCRLLARVPREVADVQRVIFLSTHRSAPLAESEGFYRERFLVRDVMTYFAAREAVAAIDHLRNYAARLERPQPVPLPALSDAECFARLSNWHDLFSITGRGYGALHRTLDRLRVLRPSWMLVGLHNVRLERSIDDPLVLRALLQQLGRRKGPRHPSRDQVTTSKGTKTPI